MKTVADLHMHSTCSDGALPPQQILAQAEQKGLLAFSVTDHDTLDFYRHVDFHDPLIPGIELSTHFQGQSVHLLVYRFDPKDNVIHQIAQTCREARTKRFFEIGDFLRHTYGLDCTPEAQHTHNQTTGFYAEQLIRQGHVRYPATVYARYLNPKHCPYVGYSGFPDLIELLQKLKNTSGFCILAHPGVKFYRQVETLDAMVEYGLDGIEVTHPMHNRRQRVWFRRYCKERQLSVTGGSDFHSKTKSPHPIGGLGLDHHQWENLKQRWAY